MIRMDFIERQTSPDRCKVPRAIRLKPDTSFDMPAVADRLRLLALILYVALISNVEAQQNK